MSEHRKNSRKEVKKDSKEDSKKRKREPIGSIDGPTVGQLTSHIANKQVRAEQYAKLKHKAKVHNGATCVAPSSLFLKWRCQTLILLKSGCAEREGGGAEETAGGGAEG